MPTETATQRISASGSASRARRATHCPSPGAQLLHSGQLVNPVRAPRCVVWWSDPSVCEERHAGLLDDAERARLTRLLREEDKARFTVGACMLRLVVAEATGTPPVKATGDGLRVPLRDVLVSGRDQTPQAQTLPDATRSPFVDRRSAPGARVRRRAGDSEHRPGRRGRVVPRTVSSVDQWPRVQRVAPWGSSPASPTAVCSVRRYRCQGAGPALGALKGRSGRRPPPRPASRPRGKPLPIAPKWMDR